jgi:hypothetical protein
MVLRLRHDVTDGSGERHACEVVARKPDELTHENGAIQIAVILDALKTDPTFIARRLISNSTLQHVVQTELFSEGRVGGRGDPLRDSGHPCSSHSVTADDAVMLWARKGIRPKLSHLVFWLLDRLVLANTPSDGDYEVFSLKFRDELVLQEHSPTANVGVAETMAFLSTRTAGGLSPHNHTASWSRTRGMAGAGFTGTGTRTKAPREDPFKVDNTTYRVMTDLKTTKDKFKVGNMYCRVSRFWATVVQSQTTATNATQSRFTLTCFTSFCFVWFLFVSFRVLLFVGAQQATS